MLSCSLRACSVRDVDDLGPLVGTAARLPDAAGPGPNRSRSAEAQPRQAGVSVVERVRLERAVLGDRRGRSCVGCGRAASPGPGGPRRASCRARPRSWPAWCRRSRRPRPRMVRASSAASCRILAGLPLRPRRRPRSRRSARAAPPRPRLMIRSASRRPSSTTDSRSASSSWAWRNSSGSSAAELVEQAEHLAAVDDAGGRHRHRAGVLDDGDELVELVVHVHGRRSSAWGRVVRAAWSSGSAVEPGAQPGAARRRAPARTTSPPHVATSLTRLDERNE